MEAPRYIIVSALIILQQRGTVPVVSGSSIGIQRETKITESFVILYVVYGMDEKRIQTGQRTACKGKTTPHVER